MTDQHPAPESGTEAAKSGKQNEIGESLWVDALKSMGCGLTLLLLTIVIGGVLAVAIIAPWGRASHDCSIYCVIGKQFEKYF